MYRTAAATALLLLFLPVATATGIGITPARLDLGTHAPGDTFYGDFNVLAAGNTSVTVDLSAGTASLERFRELDAGAPDRFSAQDCSACVTFLRGEGVIRERDRRIQDTTRWNTVRFLVDLPRDIEPGYHVLTVTPHPSRTDASGSVSMVATPTLPVIFHVPGRAVRSGMMLGVRRGETVDATRELVSRFYNNGTVTMAVSTRYAITGPNGSTTIPAGTKRVAPGETASFTAAARKQRVNGSTVTAIADYGTGTARATAPFDRAEPGPVQPAFDATGPLLILLLVLVSTVTWRVMRSG